MKEGSQSRPKHPMRENAVYEYDAKHKDQLMQDGKHNERQPDTKQEAQLNPQRRNKGKRGEPKLARIQKRTVCFPARTRVPESAPSCNSRNPHHPTALSLRKSNEHIRERRTAAVLYDCRLLKTAPASLTGARRRRLCGLRLQRDYRQRLVRIKNMFIS